MHLLSPSECGANGIENACVSFVTCCADTCLGERVTFGESTDATDEWDALGTKEGTLAFSSCCTVASGKANDGTFLLVVGVGVEMRTVAPLHIPFSVFNS